MVQLGHKDQNPNSILYTQTPYHASGILKKLSYVTQDMKKNAHTSKILWPRCTEVKHVSKKTYVCHLAKIIVQYFQ